MPEHHGKPDGKIQQVEKIEKIKERPTIDQTDMANYREMQDALDYVQQRFIEHGLIPGKKVDGKTVEKEEQQQPNVPKDQFRKTHLRSRGKVYPRIESTHAYQSFKLIGTDFIVHDFRDGIPEEQLAKKTKADKMYEDKIAKVKGERAATGEFTIKEGELDAAQKNAFSVYSDRSNLCGNSSKTGFVSTLRRMLTDFEKLLVARFERGVKIIKELVGLNPIFNKKTDKQWMSFFLRFKSRGINKKISVKNIKKFVFRGLMDFPDDAAAKILIADMEHQTGKLEKFVRLKIPLKTKNVLEKFGGMEPGSYFDIDMLVDEVGERFIYKAITYGQNIEDIKYAKLPTGGKFMPEGIEKRVAEHLGVQVDRNKKK